MDASGCSRQADPYEHYTSMLFGPKSRVQDAVVESRREHGNFQEIGILRRPVLQRVKVLVSIPLHWTDVVQIVAEDERAFLEVY